MESAPSGAMLSVLLPAAEASAYEGEGVWLSVENGPGMSVLSCTEASLSGLEARLDESGVSYQRLQTSHAFHCGLMDGVLGELDGFATGLKVGAAKIPYVSNVTGEWVDAELAGDPGYWSRQVRGAVRFGEGVETVLAAHPDCVLLEVGPGQVLSQLVRGMTQDRAVVRTQGGATEEGEAGEWLAKSLGELWCAGVEVDWDQAVRGERPGGRP